MITLQRTAQPEYQSASRMLILDASASMYSHTQELKESVNEYIKHCGDSDTFTLMLFSGENFTPLVESNLSKADASDFMQQYRVHGTTCYSKPMDTVGTVFNEMDYYVMFTDGMPVVSWSYEEEVERTKRAMGVLNAEHFDIIGYGNYYDSQLLSEISSISNGGSWYHSNVSQLASKLGDLAKSTSKITPLAIDVDPKGFTVILNTNTGIANQSVGKLATLTNDNEMLITTGDSIASLGTEVADTHPTYVYALIQGLYRNGLVNDAIDVLQDQPEVDKYVLTQLQNAFTAHERADLLDYLVNCSKDTSHHNVEGVISSSNNDVNAPCALELISKLSALGAKYYPFHDRASDYHSIGRKASSSDNSMFTPKAMSEASGDFTTIVSNAEKLNVSIRVAIPGSITVPDELAKEHGLDTVVYCSKFRVHTIISDGEVNVRQMVISVPTDKVNKYLLQFVDEKLGVNDGNAFLLINVPKNIISKQYKETMFDNKPLPTPSVIAGQIAKRTALQAEQKVINDAIKALPTHKKKGIFYKYTAEAVRVLESLGVSKEGYFSDAYSPVDPNKEYDYYMPRVIDYSVPGAFPSLAKYHEKAEKVKSWDTNSKGVKPTFTVREQLLGNAIDIHQTLVDGKNYKALKDELGGIKKEIAGINGMLFLTNLSLIATYSWFNETDFDAEDKKGNQLKYTHIDGVELTVTFKQTRKKTKIG